MQINAHTVNAQYLPNGKSYEVQTWYTDGAWKLKTHIGDKRRDVRGQGRKVTWRVCSHQTCHRDSPSWVLAIHFINIRSTVTKWGKYISGDRVAGVSLHSIEWQVSSYYFYYYFYFISKGPKGLKLKKVKNQKLEHLNRPGTPGQQKIHEIAQSWNVEWWLRCTGIDASRASPETWLILRPKFWKKETAVRHGAQSLESDCYYYYYYYYYCHYY